MRILATHSIITIILIMSLTTKQNRSLVPILLAGAFVSVNLITCAAFTNQISFVNNKCIYNGSRQLREQLCHWKHDDQSSVFRSRNKWNQSKIMQSPFRFEDWSQNDSDMDYLVTDSNDIPDESRPSLWEALKNPRDSLAMLLLIFGGAVSFCNITGTYSDMIYIPLELWSIALGILSGVVAFIQVGTGYMVNKNSRRGVADDKIVNIYGGLYSFAVSWLAFRTSNACPHWLISLDGILPLLATLTFALAAIAPAITLFNPGKIFDEKPELSNTELLRVRGLLVIGILGSVFIPDTLSFTLGGSEWWDKVSSIYPSQRTLESSTSLFALYSTEASMIAHRCGKVGIAPFIKIVPTFATVCFVLAVIPCVAALFWIGNDVSFFSFYFLE